VFVVDCRCYVTRSVTVTLCDPIYGCALPICYILPHFDCPRRSTDPYGYGHPLPSTPLLPDCVVECVVAYQITGITITVWIDAVGVRCRLNLDFPVLAIALFTVTIVVAVRWLPFDLFTVVVVTFVTLLFTFPVVGDALPTPVTLFPFPLLLVRLRFALRHLLLLMVIPVVDYRC